MTYRAERRFEIREFAFANLDYSYQKIAEELKEYLAVSTAISAGGLLMTCLRSVK